MSEHRLGPEHVASVVCHNANLIADGAFTATRYKNGVLTVTVPSSSHASEVQAGLVGIRHRIRERVSPHPVTRILIRVA